MLLCVHVLEFAHTCSVSAAPSALYRLRNGPISNWQKKENADDLRQFVRKLGIYIGLQGCTDQVLGQLSIPPPSLVGDGTVECRRARGASVQKELRMGDGDGRNSS